MRGDSQSDQKTEIWAIGGGKGGTGKSFITSALGTQLAKTGNKVILIDVDIGGANLHSFLGINQPKKSLTDFFERKAELPELVVQAGIDNLGFIAGDIHSLASDSIKYFQKQKLYRQIKHLKADYVLIDIGAGSHNNILDTFLLSDKMIAVLVPEILAVENLYHFIKNTMFRKLKLLLRPYGYREFVDQVWKIRERYKIQNLWELMDWLKENFSFIGEVIEQDLAGFEFSFIMNQVKNRQDIAMGSFVKSAFKKFLDLDTTYTGYVEYEDYVPKSVSSRQLFMVHHASTSCAQEIEAVLSNLIQCREVKLSYK